MATTLDASGIAANTTTTTTTAAASTAGGGLNLFREKEKLYKKRKIPKADLDLVFDFGNMENNASENRNRIVDLTQQFNVKAYSVLGKDGFIFLPGFISPASQRQFIRQSLLEYPNDNPSNLDPHFANIPKGENLWRLARSNPTAPLSLYDQLAEKGLHLTYQELYHRMRWITLGHHYDWTTKIYPEGRVSTFPPDLAEFCEKEVALRLGFKDYKAQAAIVNYYHVGDTLSCHNDRSEQNHLAPLISASFGQSAIFLLGGLSRESEPIAMYVRSGDVVIMHDNARLCYHAVPRILENTLPDYLVHSDDGKDGDWVQILEYLGNSRVNINVRQVF